MPYHDLTTSIEEPEGVVNATLNPLLAVVVTRIIQWMKYILLASAAKFRLVMSMNEPTLLMPVWLAVVNTQEAEGVVIPRIVFTSARVF